MDLSQPLARMPDCQWGDAPFRIFGIEMSNALDRELHIIIFVTVNGPWPVKLQGSLGIEQHGIVFHGTIHDTSSFTDQNIVANVWISFCCHRGGEGNPCSSISPERKQLQLSYNFTGSQSKHTAKVIFLSKRVRPKLQDMTYLPMTWKLLQALSCWKCGITLPE